MVQRAPLIRGEQSLSFARWTPTIDIIKRHFRKLVMARERRNEKAEMIKKRMIMRVPKWQTSRSLWLYRLQSAWCVGRNFCGYLILRFFPNRKNSQNIVPANNSNNKVDFFAQHTSFISVSCLIPYCCSLGHVLTDRHVHIRLVKVSF